MANTDKNFDEYVQKKLSNYEVKPSRLAWERLDQKLSEHNRKTAFPFLKIAATILILISAGYVFYTMNLEVIDDSKQLAVHEEIIKQDNKITSEISESPSTGLIEGDEKAELKEKKAKPIQPKVVKTAPVRSKTRSQQLVAEASKPLETLQNEKIELPEIPIPELDIRESIALNTADIGEEEEIAYKVTIISRGLKEEPAKQNLLEEIEEKVDKIGGLFSKVEQGFADLQDAKNNLFANSNPRKERSR